MGSKKRRRPGRRWPLFSFRQPIVLFPAAFVIFGTIGCAGWWLSDNEFVTAIKINIQSFYHNVNQVAGFVVRDVLVEGRKETPRSKILSALDVNRGDFILDVDIDRARQRLESIGWIKTARVERHLPDTIRVFINERTPIAIWQRDGNFVLVDESGGIIGSDGIEKFAKLKVVVGEDAPQKASALIKILELHPELMARVKAGFRLGGRRWNLRFDNGIDVRLPEINANSAWSRLARYQEQHKLLSKDVGVIDLRFSDRIVVKIRDIDDDRNIEGGNQT